MTRFLTDRPGSRSRYDTSVFDEHRLDNGATVWVQRSPIQLSEEGILAAYFPQVGSALDPAGKEGLAHFFEHMPFKGTERFPDRTALTRALREVGGSFNATTSQIATWYYATAVREGADRALEVLADLVLRPLMRQADFETERGVIHAERARKFEHGAVLARHDVDALLHGDHPAFRWGIGSPASIDSISLEDVLAFRDRHYCAANLHVVVGGAFSEDPGMLAKVVEAFSGMQRGEKTVPDMPALLPVSTMRGSLADPRYGRGRFHVDWMVAEPVTRESMDALGLLLAAFSGGSDAPLPLELRERRGLVYENQLLGRYWIWDLGARVSLELPVPPDQFEEILGTTLRLLREMPEERLTTILNRWQVDRLAAFSNPIRVCRGLSGDLFRYGRPVAMHEEEAWQDDIDADLARWWREYLLATPPAIVETSTGS